jgi:lambda family phage portal protein
VEARQGFSIVSGWAINPKTGLMTRPRTAPRSKARFYSAASNEAFVGWDVVDASPNASLHGSAIKLLARARDLERNNDYIRAYLRLNEINIIGPQGVTLRPCKKKERGDRQLDDDFNDDFKAWYKLAGKLRHSPTIEGGMSRIDIGKMWNRRLDVDGEVILIRRYGEKWNRFGYARQFIDAAQLDHSLNGRGYPTAAPGNMLKMGVEVDEDDRPVAYHFLTAHPSEHLWSADRKREHVRIEAKFVEHSFIKERPGQMRGVSNIAPGAVRARMLDKFEEAIAVGARVAASKMGFYTTDENYDGGGEDDEGEPGVTDDDGFSLRQEVEPGMFEKLAKGMGVETFDPGYPPGNLDEFVLTMGRGLAASLGANYFLMCNDMKGISYSTMRGVELSMREVYRMRTRFYVEHHLEPDLHAATEAGILVGAVPEEGKARKMLDEECYRFQGRGFTWVDPTKDMQANKDAVELGVTSEQRLIEEIHGEEMQTILEEKAAFKEQAETLGLTVYEGTAPSAPNQSHAEDDD